MPNELENALNATPDFSQHKKLSHVGGSTVTMMLWTLSGMVLAACSGGHP